MTRALVPGSFDPPTAGHLDIIARASVLYEELVVGIGINPGKPGMFTVDERLDMLRQSTMRLPNVRVDAFEGLLVDYCRAHEIPVVIKGLRGMSDFDYELQMAQMNRHLAGVETVFLPAQGRFGFVSSSLVREVAAYGGDVRDFVSEYVHERLRARLDGE